MTLEQLIEKLNHYKHVKAEMEQNEREQLGNIEQKVLEYRLELATELENSVKVFADKLHAEHETEHSNDLAKVDNYIELLENLIKEQTQEEDDVNE